MFNRYLNPDGFSEIPRKDAEHSQTYEDISPPKSAPSNEKQKSSSRSLFGGGIKLPEFDADTILMLVLVYFLISDELSPSSKEDGDNEKSKNNISDTLLIIGALLLLGF